MRLLHHPPVLSQRQLAEHLGISLGAVHYCLKALVAKGYVKAQNFAGNPNKLQYAYLLTPAGIRAKSELTRRFVQRKLQEHEALRQEVEAMQRDSTP